MDHVRRVLPALTSLAFAFVPACSSSSPATPQVALRSDLGSSTAHPQSDCKLVNGPWLNVGTLASTSSTKQIVPVPDGSVDNGHTVHVTECSVAPDGDGFLVHVAVSADEPNGGTFTLSGHFTPTGTQTNLQASFGKSDTGSFIESDCTAEYLDKDGTVLAQPNNTTQSVAGGRVWATLACPNVALASQNRTCGATAEFRFENCSQ